MRVLTYSTTITLTQHTYMLGSGTAGAFLFLPTPPHLWHRARISGPVPSILASRPVCIPSFRKRHPQVGDHLPAKAHKNPDFVLEMSENRGSEGQKSTKMEFLCSKRPKMRVPKVKSAQKPRFCARNARKRGSRRPKKHKNGVFVLGRKGIGTGKCNRCLLANHRAQL